jgi:hypothetical protein
MYKNIWECLSLIQLNFLKKRYEAVTKERVNNKKTH